MGKTSIEWTRGDDGSAGATWNPIRGCSRITPGCGGPNHQGGCYAEKIAARFSGPGQPFEGFAERSAHGGRWTGKMALVDDMLTLPLRWKRPRRIFVNSMSDLFHDNLPDEAIDKVFAVMALCPQHTFQVLTKRADRMRTWFAERWQGTPAQRIKVGREIVDIPAGGETGRKHQVEIAVEAVLEDFPKMTDTSNDDLWTDAGSLKIRQYKWPLPNVWLGVSVEDRARKPRIADLRATPAAIRFLSCEPLLEGLGELDLTGIHQVIIGGESGPRSRPFALEWARSIVGQCKASGVACFVKQLGAKPGDRPSPQSCHEPIKLKDRKGGDWSEWPEDLRVREFPT
ncbi:DUF5131 family protein [Reyranella massiliensis]|uniref:DUF5131 family protein n=1 Tax=Reyranella massiliensis TaxID=445220 RepID=UPI0002E16FFF|nr:DUF5131 family protein [Reyranella massiliensis]